MNAKVAIKLLRKLGLNNITHAQDGIEGKPYEVQILSFKALEACNREKFDLCFMGTSSSLSALLKARSPDASYSQIQIPFILHLGMDGLSATKILITEYPESKRPTVIAMTAKYIPL